MKICIVGCGAIGSYYGAKLLNAGNETWFLLRSDYDQVSKDGVFIESVDGDFHVNPLSAKCPDEVGICDAVFIGLKTTANNQLKQLITPLVDSHTMVVTLQNGLGNEEKLAEFLSAKNILGGLCFVCLNRIRPGYIRHINGGDVSIGEFTGKATDRTYQIANMFESVGIRCNVCDNLQKAHWEKLIWNIPYNGLGVAACAGYETVLNGSQVDFSNLNPCLPTDKIHADKRWESLLIELMKEVVSAGNNLGLQISESKIDYNISRTQDMGDYWASTLLDFKNRRPIELDSMFKIPLQIGKSAGTKMPYLENMCCVLEQLATLCN